jgi:hypothetical protein
MPGPNATVDILSGMPVWVQVAANLGMFVVAVVAAVFGRRWSMGGTATPIAGHPVDNSQLQRIGDEINEALTAQERCATALEGILTVIQANAREDDIEREVKRRLKDHGVPES